MYVGRLLCVPSLLLASCLYLLKDLPWPCTASCCCCCSGGGGGGGSQGKGRARREHLRMTHISFKWLKPAKNKLTWSDITNFFMQNSFRFRQFRALHFQNLSNCCRHKYDPSISQVFQSKFWRVFEVWHNCVTAGVSAAWSQSVSRGRWTALFRQARSKCWAARAARRASVCLQRREESIYCWKEEGRTPLWFDKQNNIQNFWSRS